MSTQIPGSNGNFIDEIYSGSSIDKGSGDGYVLEFDIHINRRNRILRIGIRLNYLGLDSSSINDFPLNLDFPLSLCGILCLLLGTVPQEMSRFATEQATSRSLDAIAFLFREASTFWLYSLALR